MSTSVCVKQVVQCECEKVIYIYYPIDSCIFFDNVDSYLLC